MARERAEDRYRPRPQATRRIVVVKGDDARSYTVRPWIAGLVAICGIALSVGYIGSTAYLLFRDDLINASFTRKADLQQAYEDRIASLRSEIDKIASRQLLDQVAYDEKVERLLAAQRNLDDRQKAVSTLLDQARSSGLLDDAATADDRAAADPSITGSTADSYAADTTAADIERRFAALGESSATVPVGPDGKPDLKALASDLNRMTAEQAAAVQAIANAAETRADQVATIVERLGVTVNVAKTASVKSDRVDEALGGPFIPMNSPEALASAMADASAAFEKLGVIRKAVGKLPVVAPLASGSVTSNFGSRSDPFLGSTAFHAGIDFRAPTGRDVAATAPGTVVTAGRNGGYGNMVEIDHGHGLTTRYAHLSKIKVELGQKVARGAIIGEVGSTGRSTGPHLHYETRVNGTAVNPMTYLTAGRQIKKLLH
ncbi:M23 family metallopeptidase [Chthonobacter albigriseus]|uniref:M23 family metallopeptidase n=1 Tax=Chthonobacter albigriseus TaxID=1683161 RepID=UPI0015EF814A|nr:M23 family metallopeptidase [Chthonobacter albigriseus]